MVKSNWCPYCDAAPYTLADGGCRDHCEQSEIVKQMVKEAAIADEMGLGFTDDGDIKEEIIS